MSVRDTTISRIESIPEPLVQEVLNFIDFLMARSDAARWEAWQQFAEGTALAEAGMSDYLTNLTAYEDQLAAGKISW